MNERYRLGGLENGQLLAALSGLVKRENDSLSDLLAHLAELDDRQLCVALGYSSLFAYCTEALGFCRSSAGRRIAAARVCREYPEAFTRVANGELQLSVLCALRPHLKAENAAELFAACSRKSYEQVEELLAARFPKPDVRDLIRRLPTPQASTPHIGSKPIETQQTELTQTPPLREASTEPTLPPVTQTTAEAHRPLAQRGALKPLSAVRDEGRCTFCSDDGRCCGERRLLQLDHVIPHAKGGEPTVGNLRLRCRAHNLHMARIHFGIEHVRAAMKRSREGSRRAGRNAR